MLTDAMGVEADWQFAAAAVESDGEKADAVVAAAMTEDGSS